MHSYFLSKYVYIYIISKAKWSRSHEAGSMFLLSSRLFTSLHRIRPQSQHSNSCDLQAKTDHFLTDTPWIKLRICCELRPDQSLPQFWEFSLTQDPDHLTKGKMTRICSTAKMQLGRNLQYSQIRIRLKARSHRDTFRTWSPAVTQKCRLSQRLRTSPV